MSKIELSNPFSIYEKIDKSKYPLYGILLLEKNPGGWMHGHHRLLHKEPPAGTEYVPGGAGGENRQIFTGHIQLGARIYQGGQCEQLFLFERRITDGR